MLTVKSFYLKMVDPTDEPIDLSMVDPNVRILQIKKLYNNSSLCIKYCFQNSLSILLLLCHYDKKYLIFYHISETLVTSTVLEFYNDQNTKKREC